MEDGRWKNPGGVGEAQRGHMGMTFLRMAKRTRSVWERRPSLRIRFARWVSAVRGLINSLVAISPLVFPSAANWRTRRIVVEPRLTGKRSQGAVRALGGIGDQCVDLQLRSLTTRDRLAQQWHLHVV